MPIKIHRESRTVKRPQSRCRCQFGRAMNRYRREKPVGGMGGGIGGKRSYEWLMHKESRQESRLVRYDRLYGVRWHYTDVGRKHSACRRDHVCIDNRPTSSCQARQSKRRVEPGRQKKRVLVIEFTVD
jgi:hypothetical protein